MEAELSPRNCAEELGHTFLPCVLANLARADSAALEEQLASSERRQAEMDRKMEQMMEQQARMMEMKLGRRGSPCDSCCMKWLACQVGTVKH